MESVKNSTSSKSRLTPEEQAALNALVADIEGQADPRKMLTDAEIDNARSEADLYNAPVVPQRFKGDKVRRYPPSMMRAPNTRMGEGTIPRPDLREVIDPLEIERARELLSLFGRALDRDLVEPKKNLVR